MTDYSALQKPELVQLCRDRGLTTSGTKEELTARLEHADEQGQEPVLVDEPEVVMVDDQSGTQGHPMESPLVEADRSEDDEGTPTPAEGSQADDEPPSGHDDTPGDAPLPVSNPPIRAFRATFTHTGELDDASHRRYLQAAHDAAQAAGHQTKGYPLAGHRVEHVGNTVTYEVALRRKA